jgi:hypothetical protein
MNALQLRHYKEERRSNLVVGTENTLTPAPRRHCECPAGVPPKKTGMTGCRNRNPLSIEKPR